MKRLIALSIAAGSAAVVSAADMSAKDALSTFFTSEHASFSYDQRRNTLEVCWDLCEYYEMRNGASSQAWDVVFLHQYYFVAPEFREQFREKYANLAKNITAKYASSCASAPPDNVPSCVVKSLGARNRVAVAFVRYDEGYRCQVWGALTDPKFQGKSKCTKVKHAS